MIAKTSFILSNVLIAGGDEALRNSLAEVLHLHQDSLRHAPSAGEVLEHLQGGLVVTLAAVDLDSPGMSDPGFVGELKTRGPSIALLLVSSSFDHAFLVDLLVSGSTFFLKKPCDRDAITLAVEQLSRAAGEEAPKRELSQPFKLAGVMLEYRTDEINPGLVGSRLAAILASAGVCDARSAGLIEIAVHESLVNALEHGNLELSSKLKSISADEPDRFALLRQERLQDEQYAGRTIRVRFQLDTAKMEVQISDQGRGFDHAHKMKNLFRRVEPESLTDCHGRGLLMVSCCMDNVSFNETGNQVTFTRYNTEESIRLPDFCRPSSDESSSL